MKSKAIERLVGQGWSIRQADKLLGQLTEPEIRGISETEDLQTELGNISDRLRQPAAEAEANPEE